MNKLKILIITAITVLSSCIFSFADSPSNLAFKEYYVKIKIISKNQVQYYTSDSDFYIEDGYLRCKGNYFVSDSQGNLGTQYVASAICSVEECEFLDTNHSGLRKQIDFIENNGGTTNPPVVNPMGVEKIIPHLLEQLKILLPIGVIILSLLLGTRLVPRLIRLFQ